MELPLATSDVQSLERNVPRVKVSNFYVVENPFSPSGRSYLPRPAVTSFLTCPEAPVRGFYTFQQNGVTVQYVVAGLSLYSLSSDNVFTRIGEVQGTGVCFFASTVFSMGIITSGFLYLLTGTTLERVLTPDDRLATSIASSNNYLLITFKDFNSIYWINPGDTFIDDLSFISAERNPDDVVSVVTVGDELWLLGARTTEVFSASGDADAPFLRIPGRVYDTGCVDPKTSLSLTKDGYPTLVWVTTQNEVYITQGAPSKISNKSIEELLKRSTTYTAWSFRALKNTFYVLSTDVFTGVFDIENGEWYRWSSNESDTWAATAGWQVRDEVFVTDLVTASLSKLTNEYRDAVDDFLVCEVSGYIPYTERGAMSCSRVSLFMNYGSSNSYAVSPVIELRWSDDGGFTWSDYMQAPAGRQGSYSTDILFRSLGVIRKPGRYFEIRFSEVQPFRLDGATINV